MIIAVVCCIPDLNKCSSWSKASFTSIFTYFYCLFDVSSVIGANKSKPLVAFNWTGAYGFVLQPFSTEYWTTSSFPHASPKIISSFFDSNSSKVVCGAVNCARKSLLNVILDYVCYLWEVADSVCWGKVMFWGSTLAVKSSPRKSLSTVLLICSVSE